MTLIDVEYFANHAAIILKQGTLEAEEFVDCVLESMTYYGAETQGYKSQILTRAEIIAQGSDEYGLHNTCRIC